MLWGMDGKVVGEGSDLRSGPRKGCRLRPDVDWIMDGRDFRDGSKYKNEN